MESTSKRLYKIMNEKNLRQVDVLNLAKPFCEKYNVRISKSDLSQFLSGAIIPGTKKLLMLGMALDVSEPWLMGYDDVSMSRNTPIITSHKGIADDGLWATSILLEKCGYTLQFFANQFQIIRGDIIIKLSLDEVENLANCVQTQLTFAVESIISNKLYPNIPKNGTVVDMPKNEHKSVNAAHARTDIEITDEMKQHDDDIMDDKNF